MIIWLLFCLAIAFNSLVFIMNRSVGVTQTRTSSASRPLPPNPSRGPTTTTTNSSVRTRQSSATRRPSTDSTRVLPQEQRRRVNSFHFISFRFVNIRIVLVTCQRDKWKFTTTTDFITNRNEIDASRCNGSPKSRQHRKSSQIDRKYFHLFRCQCFMNSVLQCLSNTKPLLLLCFREDLDSLFNRSSTSAMKGSLMRGKTFFAFEILFSFDLCSSLEYAKLIQNMWGGDSRTVVSPQAFKSVVGRFASRFLGYA